MKLLITCLLSIALAFTAAADSCRLYLDSITALDNTRVALPLNSTSATTAISIEARAAFNHASTNPTHETRSWGIIFATTDSGDPYSITISPSDKDFDPNYNIAAMAVTIACGDSIILAHRFKSGFSLTKGAFNTIVAEIDISTEKASFFGGNRQLVHLGDINWSGTPSPAIIATTPITISTLMTETATNPVAAAMTPWTIPDIDAHINNSSDPVEGYWTYLDRDNDPRFAIPGGRYTLATIASSTISGAYDIIYIDGATTSGQQWKPGMLKGRLLPTAFLNHYDLQWTDASFLPITRDIHASITQGSILSLSFPLYHTTIRFSRSLPTNR